MKTITVKFHKLHENAKVPVYGTHGAAGADLCAIEDCAVMPMGHRLIKTGLAIELPAGYEAQVRPRSGLALKYGITVLNTPGTIDSDYRGEVGVILYNTNQFYDFKVKAGDRIAQLVVAPFIRAEFMEEELTGSLRGAGGFGSTGV